jgi:glutaredoxin
LKVVLYTKTDCSLCGGVEEVLRELQQKIRFSLEIVDIEADSAAYARYWDRIPVVTVGGTEVAHAPVDTARLTADLKRLLSP